MTAENPDISVILPIRNGMPLLVKAMEALRAQTYGNFTVFVQDALSTDGTLEYLRGFEAPFRIDIVSEADGSLTKGYNRALKRATGDLVVPTACDEAMLPFALETYARWSRDHPNAVFVYGGSRLVDADGTTVEEFHPRDFDLIDYLRYAHDSCPTQLGFYNRRLLGDELYFDERLETVPDSEFVTRWALKFGPDRIVAKPEITSTARRDETSASYRADSLGDQVRDKTTMLNRLLHGELKDLFMQHLERDLKFRLYSRFASTAYGIEGDTALFRDFTLKADAEVPGHALTRFMAKKSSSLEWRDDTRRLSVRDRVAPASPPADASQAFVILPETMTPNPYWVGQGAQVTSVADGALVKTPPLPWHYAARAPLDFSGVDFAEAFCWLRVRMRAVTQPILLSLFDENANQIFYEWTLPADPGTQTLTVEVPRRVGTSLMIRSGDQPLDAQGVFLGAELLTAS